MRRSRPLVHLCVLLAVGACAQGESDASGRDEAIPEATTTQSPGHDYRVRLDSERSDPDEFQLSVDGEYVHFVTGPAGIAWRPQDVVTSGYFRVEAVFRQFGAPMGYREAYGIFVGGRDLEGPDQEYTYLLVRPTGDFLVKRRRGETTEVLVDWTPHESVHSVQVEGDEPENTLAVDVAEGETLFLVNGVEVHRMPTPVARPYGILGLRANHRLDVRVSSFSISPPPAGTTS